MSKSKLKTLHVVIIGCLACALVAGGLYFFVIKKANERIAGLEAQLQQLTAEAEKKSSVEAQLVAAREENRIVSAKYERYLREKMPPISFQDRAQGMIALWKEQAEVLGPMVQSWPNKTGVRFSSGVKIPAAPVNPNSVNTSIISIPIGNFNVTGDFHSILNHIRSWNKFNRLVQIDLGKLSGASPNMTAEYRVTVHIFPRGEAGQPVTMAGGSETVSGGGATFTPADGGGVDQASPSLGEFDPNATPQVGMPAPSM